MSDVINVKIIGDLAYVNGVTDAAEKAATDAKQSATDAENFLAQMKVLPADLEILNDGASLGTEGVESINFKGSGVTASKLQDGVYEVTITGGGGSGSSDTGEDIRDKLEALAAGQRVDADHIDETLARKFITTAQADIIDKAVTTDSQSPADNHVAVWESGKIKAGSGIGTSAGDLVQLDGTAKLPAIDGSQLTNLPLVDHSVSSVSFEGNNMVFTFKDGSRVILANAKVELKGNKGDAGDKGDKGDAGTAGAGYPDEGSIGQSDDPKSKPTGAYYVTESFVGAPSLHSGDYVGMMMIQNDIDSDNGRHILYFNTDGMFTLTKEAGGWDTSWKHYAPGVSFSDDGTDLGVFSNVDFRGNGVSVARGASAVEVTVETSAAAPTLALHFSGIYGTVQELQDTVPSPSDHMQAIVLSPDDKYYHAVGGAWVPLAPVGSFHSNYLGAFDNIGDLNSSEPNPDDDALAIIGTASMSFYIYDGSAWKPVTHTDLPSINARLNDAEGKISSLNTLTGTHTTEIGTLTRNIAEVKADQFHGSVISDAADANRYTDVEGLRFMNATVSKPNGSPIVEVTVDSVSQSDLTDLESKVTGNTTNIAGISSELDLAKQSISNHDNALISIDQSIDANQSNIATLDGEVKQLQSEGSGIDFQDPTGVFLPATSVTVMPPLKVESGGQTGEIALSTDHKETSTHGFYATLVADQPVYSRLGIDKHYPVFFPNVVVGDSMGIYAAPTEKAYTIVDTADENFTESEGTDYLIEAVLNIEGEAPEDGFLRAYLIDVNEGGDGSFTEFVRDANGNPMLMQYNYKSGQSFGKIVLSGIVHVTNEQRFQVQLVRSFGSHELVIKSGFKDDKGSSLLIQELSNRGQTSIAMLQFESDNDVSVKFAQFEMGSGIVNTQSAFLTDVSSADYPANSVEVLDPSIFAVGHTGFSYSIENSKLTISSKESPAAYYVCARLDKEMTYILRGKQVTFTASIKHPTGTFAMFAAEYTSDGSPSNDFMTTPTADIPLGVKPGWYAIGAHQEIQPASSGVHDHSITITIPDSANVMMFAISTNGMVTSSDIEMNRLVVDVVDPFKYSAVKSQSFYHNNYITLSTETLHMTSDAGGMILSGVDEAMPLGTFGHHSDSLAWHDDSNGAQKLYANVDGEITIDTKVRLSNSSDVESSVQFAWYLVDGNGEGNDSIFPSTQTLFTLPANSDGYSHVYNMGSLSAALEEGQELRLKAAVQSGGTTGIKLVEGGADKPMVESVITYRHVPVSNEPTPSPDLIYAGEAVKHSSSGKYSYEFTGNTSDSVVVPDIEIYEGTEFALHAVSMLHEGRVRSVRVTEYEYNPVAQTITVKGLSSVADGKIHMEFWK